MAADVGAVMSELKPNLEVVLMGLQYLAGFDKADIEHDDFECLGEDENGNSGCCTLSITELAADAYELLNTRHITLTQAKQVLAEAGMVAVDPDVFENIREFSATIMNHTEDLHIKHFVDMVHTWCDLAQEKPDE